MILAGLQKNTLIDYPGKIACIVFTLGCNFRCDFCYNPDLVIHERFTDNLLQEEVFFNFLKERKNFLDAVVITGGEPTVHKDLNLFIKKIKDLGFLIKLDTQGSNSVFLSEILRENNVDYIAMDIKGHIGRYQEITNSKFDVKNILESINIIKNYANLNKNFDYEFRTTVVADQLKKEDFQKIGEMIKGSKRYFLQRFEPKKELNNPEFVNKTAYSEKEMQEFKEIMEKYVEIVAIR